MLLPIFRPWVKKISHINGTLLCERLWRLKFDKVSTYKYTKDLRRCYSIMKHSTSLRRTKSFQLPFFRRGAQLSRIYCDSRNHRSLSTNNNNNDDDEIVKVKRIYLRDPFKWFDIKVKMFLLRSYFDQEFEESEFLLGAKQAICLVTRIISEGNFKELTGMMSDKATEDSRELCRNISDITKIKVIDEEIDNISVSNLGFVYDGEGRKWADILVTCHCVADNSFVKKVANGGIFGIASQRIFNFSFVREFTPGVAADWIIDRIKFNQTLSDAH